MKIKSQKNEQLKSKNILLILGIIYTLLTILAVTSYVSNTNNISTTPVTFISVIGSIWWQLLMIIMFVVTYILYTKKPFLGMLVEIALGVSMLINVIISVAVMGLDLLALTIELIYPVVLITHGFLEFMKLRQKNKKNRRKRVSTI